ncbi:MAG TPA: hypothetical protein VFN44_18240, partial [Solirubrobacteraceae bacterium]|nr:hypothetical protein [Solirubrobacteraceae bacterium]
MFVALGALLLLPSLAAAAPELSTSDRLQDRRSVTAGERAYAMGFEDGNFYAQGWHITGEMGGVWTQPLKLVDGVWFGVDGDWIGGAKRFTSGWGYTRMRFARKGDLSLSRTDFVPDGRRGALFGLRITNHGATRSVPVMVDVHSELMSHYPWTWTKPGAGEYNLADTGAFDAAAGALTFRDQGTSHIAAGPHDWAAMVASTRRPAGGESGPGHFGPQGEGGVEVCQDQDVPDEKKAMFCDDGPFGKGTGGQLRYDVRVPSGQTRTLWIAVAGSESGPAGARTELDRMLDSPERALARKIARRERVARWTQLSLPADPQLAQAIDWGKQNLRDATQSARGLRIRDVDEGKNYASELGRVPRARWIGAGYPDYPWMFATDGEFTAFASVSVGQFEAVKDHARALRDVSVILNGDSGKVAHEIVADGSVYFGNLNHKGNTDETAKFPSMVALIWRWTGDDAFRDDLYDFARRNMDYVVANLDQDGDGWPEGLGNVERGGMGEEKLDVTVATIRGLLDLADMARAKGDTAVATASTARARNMIERFDTTWWMPDQRQYADSLDDPGDVKLQQRHWIGVTPMEIELTDERGQAVPGVASYDNGVTALADRESACYSGEFPLNRGLYHTGCGGGPEGKGETDVFSLNTAVMAVGEGNYGRLGAGQQQRYTDANRMLMLPDPDEQPGAMPEIAPSPPPRGRNIDRCTRCRSMVLQAWGNYGTLWPVVHQQLGVRPDLGRGRLEV